MTPRHLLLGALLLGAGAVAVFGDKTPDGVVAPAPRSAAAAAPLSAPARASLDTAMAKPAAAPVILRLQPRADLLGDGTLGEGATAFMHQDWTPPPPKPAPPPPPPPPSAPPLPFTYLGKAVANGEWEIYLARGDQTYIVRNKMVIDGVYRVDAIAPPTLTFTYLPLNQVQQLNIGVLD